MKNNDKILKSIFSFGAGNLASSVLGMVGGILTARYISPEINGQFRTFTIPIMYAACLHLGTFQGIQREIPYYSGRNQLDKVNKIASVAGAWNVAVAALVSFIFFAFALRSIFLDNKLAAAGWAVQAVACWNTYYGLYLGNTYRTANNFVTVARITLITSLLTFALVFTIPFFNFYGLCLRLALPAILSLWLYHRNRPLRIPLQFHYATFKELIKIGAPLYFWIALKNPLWKAVESSLMLYLAGAKGLGLFSIAIICSSSISVLPQAIFQVLKPRIAESYGQNKNISSELRQYILIALVLAVGMSIIVVIVSYMIDYFVPIIIPKYIDGIQLIKIYSWLAVIHALSLPLNGLFATGKSWLIGKGTLAGLIAFPVSVFLFIPSTGGMLAVAIGSLIGNFAWLAVGYIDVVKLIRQEKIQ